MYVLWCKGNIKQSIPGFNLIACLCISITLSFVSCVLGKTFWFCSWLRSSVLSQSGLLLNHTPVLMMVKQDTHSPKGSTQNKILNKCSVKKTDSYTMIWKHMLHTELWQKNISWKKSLCTNAQHQVFWLKKTPKTKPTQTTTTYLVHPIVLFSAWAV